MEIASLLAGQRWSDHPQCTDRLLAAIARDVNDRVDDHTRQQLLPWVPRVVGANRRHPLITAGLTMVLAAHGMPVLPHDDNLRWAAEHARRRAQAWQSGQWWRRAWLHLSEPVFRADGCYRRIPAVLAAVAAHDEHELVALLIEAITVYEITTCRLEDRSSDQLSMASSFSP